MNYRTLKQWMLIVSVHLMILAACTTTNITPSPILSTEPQQAQQEPVSITDGLGRTIKLENPAQRIISLAPSNTELLFAVGAGKQISGRDSLSDFPAEAAAIPDIGGGFGELNMESILAADPDLVLAADLTPPEQIQALEEVGLTVFALPNPTDFEGLYENIKTVAQLTGHTEEADLLVEQLGARVDIVKNKVASTDEKVLVFYELDSSDPNAPWTTGPGTFIDTLITLAGGENIGSDLEGAWIQISIEELLSRDPDIIILGDYTWGGVTPEDVAARSGWDSLKAVKNNRIYTFDDNLVSRPGPRLVDGLEAMAKLIHPALFE